MHFCLNIFDVISLFIQLIFVFNFFGSFSCFFMSSFLHFSHYSMTFLWPLNADITVGLLLGETTWQLLWFCLCKLGSSVPSLELNITLWIFSSQAQLWKCNLPSLWHERWRTDFQTSAVFTPTHHRHAHRHPNVCRPVKPRRADLNQSYQFNYMQISLMWNSGQSLRPSTQSLLTFSSRSASELYAGSKHTQPKPRDPK